MLHTGKLEQVARIASGWFRPYFLIKERSRENSGANYHRIKVIYSLLADALILEA